MRISVVTAVYNRVDCISHAIESMKGQSYSNIEHVVIDGGSTDGTLQVLQRQLDDRAILISEPDDGIYDALNKGLALATGDVVGFLHSDDFFSDASVLSDIAAAFTDSRIEAVYGDLEYVAKSDVDKVIRRWQAGDFTPRRLSWGWMPPHPTLFLRREVIERMGGFDEDFRIAADYDAILRYFSAPGFEAAYIPRVLVKMRVGGESNRSLSSIIRKSREDYRALRKNKVGGLGALFWKNISKLHQFF